MTYVSLCLLVFFVTNAILLAFSVPKSLSKSIILYKAPELEIAEDADVRKFLTVSIRVQGQEEGPFEGKEAPHAGEVEAPWVSRTCVAQEKDIENQNITFL